MGWYLWMGFFITTILFYWGGRYDEENKAFTTLTIWFVCNGIILVWLMATAWARR